MVENGDIFGESEDETGTEVKCLLLPKQSLEA